MEKKILFEAAIKEFSKNGLKNSKIENILTEANVSENEFKKEFKSKEDFFLQVVDFGTEYLQNVFDKIMNSNDPTIVKLEKLLDEAINFSLQYPDLVKLYNEITNESDNPYLEVLSKKLESISINAYRKIIEESKEKGEIPHIENTEFLAFCLDSLFVITQFSFIPGYFQERMKVYMGDKYLKDPKAYKDEMIFLISRMFTPDVEDTTY
jgi:AcrR family transcriptional regulator